jgi:hypothetical protein
MNCDKTSIRPTLDDTFSISIVLIAVRQIGRRITQFPCAKTGLDLTFVMLFGQEMMKIAPPE